MRIEPPPSLPCATGQRPAAVAAAAPPLEPPGVRATSHGLRQSPFSSDSVVAMVPNSGVFVLPSTMNPAARSRRTTAASNRGTFVAQAFVEYVVRSPAGLVEILDRDRNAVKGRVGRRRYGRVRGGECTFRVDRDVGVELRIEPLDAFQVERGELDG